MSDLIAEIEALNRMRQAEIVVAGMWDAYASCQITDYTYMHRGALVDRYMRRRWRARSMENQAGFCAARAGVLIGPRYWECGTNGERTFRAEGNRTPREATGLDILEHVCARLALNTPAHIVIMDGAKKRHAQPPILALARRHGSAWHEGMIDAA